jgi:hypothetical protein
MSDRGFTSKDPVDLARDVAIDLVHRGAEAVVLMGSHVRGDALPDSDVDVIAIGSGEPYRLERCRERLLSISWLSVEGVREHFRSPREAPGAVTGWRSAVVLADSSGVAADLQQEAREWTWAIVGDEACDAFVAEELTGLAEEVHKLVNLRRAGNLTGAAVQRSILSLRMGVIMAIHERLLYDTENQLWNLVNERMGEPWRAKQMHAFGLGGESFDETCRAALDLYRLATAEAAGLFDERQQAVVSYACELARRPGCDDR